MCVWFNFVGDDDTNLVFLWKLSTVSHGDRLGGLATLRPIPLDLLDVLHAVNDTSKHNVLPIQPRRLGRRDEELRPVRVCPGVGHGHDSRSSMGQLEVFIRKLLPINGLSSGPIPVGEVTPLTHKVGDDAMECRSLVAKALLPSAQGPEVLGRFGNNVLPQLNDNPPHGRAVRGQVEKDLGGHAGSLCLVVRLF